MAGHPTTKRLLGFDLDGVVIDQIPNRIRVVRSLGVDLSPQEASSDAIASLMSQREVEKIQDSLYYDPVVALTAPLVAGVERVLGSMSAAESPYVLISRRRDPSLAIELMKKLGIWPRYFSERNAFFVRGREEKNRLARELGVTCYVDDQPSVLDALVDVPERILLDPYEAHMDTKFIRVASWEEFLQTWWGEVK